MHLGLLRVHVRVPSAKSLKDRRQVLQSVKQRIRNSYNVSIAEISEREQRQSFDLAMAMVSGNRDHIQEIFSKAINLIASKENVVIMDETVEFF